MSRRKIILAVTTTVLAAAGFWASLALTAGETTGTVTACATATSPKETVFVNTTSLGSPPRHTATHCTTVTYTIPTVTQTVTTGEPPPPPPPGQVIKTVDLGWTPVPSPFLPWGSINQIDLFNLATENGPGLDASNLWAVNVPLWVQTAHANGKLAFIQIGGAGNDNWPTACNDANRAQFVSNLVGFASSNGFDAVDLDIEDDYWLSHGPPNDQMTACIEAISVAAHAAGMMLTADVITPWAAPWFAPADSYIDQYTLMTFYGDFASVQRDVQAAIDAGLTPSKFVVGADVNDYPYLPCGQFASYAASNGYRGAMIWEAYADYQQGNACANALAGGSP